MELKKFYESMGVDYTRVLDRLRKEDRIEKYLHIMIKDENYYKLEGAVKEHDYEEAFRVAHALKGVSLNLDLRPLAEAAGELVEYIRPESGNDIDPDRVQILFERIQREYTDIVNAVGE